MTIKERFNWIKATEALVYIAHREPNTYRALKVLYFADKEHLSKYGRQICGDSYVAMQKGPVPSGAYDLVKFVRGDGMCNPEAWQTVRDAFKVEGYDIQPLREANVDLLSESDIECLDHAVDKVKRLSRKQLIELSHKEPAYKKADLNDRIPLEDIIDSLPDGEDLKEYLRAG